MLTQLTSVHFCRMDSTKTLIHSIVNVQISMFPHQYTYEKNFNVFIKYKIINNDNIKKKKLLQMCETKDVHSTKIYVFNVLVLAKS